MSQSPNSIPGTYGRRQAKERTVTSLYFDELPWCGLNEGLCLDPFRTVLLHLCTEHLPQVIDLTLHILELTLHTQNNLDASEIDSQVAGQVQDEAELGNILLGIQTRIPSSAHRRHKASPLVETERLWMHTQHLGDAANGKNGLRVFCHNVCLA